MLHYFDDFLFIGKPASLECQTVATHFIALYAQSGVPLAANEVEGPSTRLTVLGIVIDSVTQTVSLPGGKAEEYLNDLLFWRSKTECSRVKLQSIFGKLQFAARCVPAGRLFFRPIIYLLKCTVGSVIILDHNFVLDLEWWIFFIPK